MQTFPTEQARAPDPIDPPPVHVAVRYQRHRHRQEETILFLIVEQHFPAFQRRLAELKQPLPAFVLDEFRSYLACGRMEHGFVSVKCDGCRHELLVTFSWKKRGFCPSCGSRRMVEPAAHLIDHVMPRIPVRQWVLSFPWPLRMLFAARVGRARPSDEEVSSSSFSATEVPPISTCTCTCTCWFSMASTNPSASRCASAPSEAQLQSVLTRLLARIRCRLTKDGWLSQGTKQPSLDLEPRDVLDERAAARGAPSLAIVLRRVPAPDSTPSPCGRPGWHSPPGRSRSPQTCRASRSLPSLGGRRRMHRRSAQQARTPRPLRRSPCHRPETSHRRFCRTRRARTHPPLPRWHNPHAVPPRRLARGLAGAPRRARAPSARAPHPLSRRVRAQLPTPPTCRPVAPRRCRPHAPTGQGARGVLATKPAHTERRRPAPRAHDLDREPCNGQLLGVFEIDITTCPDCGGPLRWIAGDRLRGTAFGGPPSGGRLRT